jgi:hypothetical protein
VAPGSERGAASRTSKGLDALGTAMLAISDEGVDPIIGDAEVRILLVRTGEALGLYPSGGLALRLFTSLQGRDFRRRRFHHRRVGAAEAAVGAVKWGAWRCRRRWTRVRLLPACECDG